MNTILDAMPLARLRFDLEALESAQVPAYKGSMLRMALLWWLSEYWCPMPDRCRHGCRRPDVCMFGRLCEPPVDPAWLGKMRYLIGNTPPPAYAIWDMQNRQRSFDPGTPWGFELTLVGELALQQIPAIAAAVQQGAEMGMGRIRLRSRLRRVVALTTASDSPSSELHLAVEKRHNDEMALTWQSYHLNDIAFGYEQADGWAQTQTEPIRTLSLRYLSPVKIKDRGEWVRVPEFSAVMKNVVRRLRILSQVHSAGEWPQAEFGPLLDLAETVRLDHQETFWTGYTRRSKSAGKHEIDGFIGQAWYSGDDLRPLLPALWLGQWLHIGKGYVMGSGRYAIHL